MSGPHLPYSIEDLAEDAVLLCFGTMIDTAVNERVHAAAERLRIALPELECVPAYASLLLRFDPRHWRGTDGQTAHQRLREALAAALAHASGRPDKRREVRIPTWYGGAAGPDLGEVAALTGFSAEEVIARHLAAEYRVAMLGFAPGFPYLLGLDPALAVPRRADPRQAVAAGSVAIGGSQTGIYPQQLPGGWQLIGRTPLVLFDARNELPSRLLPGDRVRFEPIGENDYRRLATTPP